MLQSCERYIPVKFSQVNRFTQNSFTCKVRNLIFIIRPLVVGTDWPINRKLNESYIFWNEKHTLLSSI